MHRSPSIKQNSAKIQKRQQNFYWLLFDTTKFRVHHTQMNDELVIKENAAKDAKITEAKEGVDRLKKKEMGNAYTLQ